MVKHPLRHLAAWSNFDQPDTLFCVYGCGYRVAQSETNDTWHAHDKTVPCPAAWRALPFWKRVLGRWPVFWGVLRWR